MKVLDIDVVFQEVPDEVSLSLGITGCSNNCPGCHTPELQNRNNGVELTDGLLKYYIKRNEGITCVLFYGGEWEKDRLIELLNIIKKEGLKSALYSGNIDMDTKIINELDYLKLGPYIEEFGPINNKNTNQRMFKKLNNGTWIDITNKFLT